jgi:rod shape determining protein RodA
MLITTVGILNLYSASFSINSSGIIYKKQICWLFLGILLLFCGSFINYSYLERYAYVFYFFSIILLIIVIFSGELVGGSRRWLSLGVLKFQPSELSKITLILALAKHFKHRYYSDGFGFSSLFFSFLLLSLPFLLIFLQPDLSTALILFLVYVSMLIFLKMRLRFIFFLVLCLIVVMPLSWNLLKPYQKERVYVFLNPQSDPLGRGYQIIQSKITIGSGKFLGKGFRGGTQTQLNFIPEKYTDFIFSVFCEEWGFLGSLVLLFLYFLLFFRSLYIVINAKDSFGIILGYGIITLFFWQFIINLGMTLGLLPIMGVTLPLFSYGGSSLVTSLFLIGVLINIHIQKFIF